MGHKFMNWARGDNRGSKIFIKTFAYYYEELETDTKCFNDGKYALEKWATQIIAHYNEDFIHHYWKWVQHCDTLNVEALGDRIRNMPHELRHRQCLILIGNLTAELNREWLNSCVRYSNLNEIPNNWGSFSNMMMKPIKDMITVLNGFVTQDILSLQNYRFDNSELNKADQGRLINIVKFNPIEENKNSRIIIGEYVWWFDGEGWHENDTGIIQLQMEIPKGPFI